MGAVSFIIGRGLLWAHQIGFRRYAKSTLEAAKRRKTDDVSEEFNAQFPSASRRSVQTPSNSKAQKAHQLKYEIFPDAPQPRPKGLELPLGARKTEALLR